MTEVLLWVFIGFIEWIAMLLLLVDRLAKVAVLKPFMYWDVTSSSEDMVILFIPPLVKGKKCLVEFLEFSLKPIWFMDGCRVDISV